MLDIHDGKKIREKDNKDDAPVDDNVVNVGDDAGGAVNNVADVAVIKDGSGGGDGESVADKDIIKQEGEVAHM